MKSQEYIIKRLLTVSSLQIAAVLSEAINYTAWKYEEFGEDARWRFTDTNDIKLQFMHNNNRHSIILNVSEEIRQQIRLQMENNEQIFTLPSLAGTSTFYAPAKIYVNTQPDYKGHRVVIRLLIGEKSVAIVAESRW